MTDEWHGVTRDEYQADRLLSSQDWADWRAARGWEPSRRPTRDEMVAHFAAERREWERQQLEGVAERAVVHDGWATYPDELRACATCGGRGFAMTELRPHLAPCPDCDGPATRSAHTLTVHATLRLTGCGDPTIDELRAQLAGLGFDTIDIEEIA